MSDQVAFLVDSKNVSGMIQQIVAMINKGLFKGPVEVILTRPLRTLSQNKKLWPMLSDVQKQVKWYGERLDSEDWKDMFMSSLNKQRSVPGIDGGFVGLNRRTSKLDKEGFTQLIEVIYAFGSERQVAWSEPSLQTYSQYKEAA
jgi:ribosomal protein L30/L7E